ncbi:carboxypeptidase-like regulatory domain-containing protein [Streptomyces sp. ST2-7A]|uniref:carboxypeptidase-like regulatory domain-containing protein n=1 Tax=Streptomyces sp. ST2-7A TaxID=2907214 RepID=UPI001F1B4ABE|nr:carboxypeptidase-like regulatory domain-containing protein [Streptomyces sp. ST2-7A]MCE7078654.1 carboxypeptidase-like regulatory domain-containing protein [Streptomyces sp. ST2-7A]
MTESLTSDLAPEPAEPPDPHLISGVVRDSFGVALPRALVTLAADGGNGRQLDKTRSATDGAFSIRAPHSGEYLLAAFSPQLGGESVLVTLDGRPVTVEFRIEVPGTEGPVAD